MLVTTIVCSTASRNPAITIPALPEMHIDRQEERERDRQGEREGETERGRTLDSTHPTTSSHLVWPTLASNTVSK